MKYRSHVNAIFSIRLLQMPKTQCLFPVYFGKDFQLGPTIPRKRRANLCSKSFRPGQWITNRPYHRNILLMGNNHRKLFVIKQSTGCICAAPDPEPQWGPTSWTEGNARGRGVDLCKMWVGPNSTVCWWNENFRFCCHKTMFMPCK